MFQDARRFDQDISCWETTKLENMEEMFDNASNFKCNISTWDLSKIVDIKNINDDNVFRNSVVDFEIVKEFYYAYERFAAKRSR